MANSYIEYEGDGTTDDFAIPFGYISKTHVKCTVNGEDVPFTWLNAATIQLTEAPEVGAYIKIYRQSSPTERLVDYNVPGTLTEEDLDTDSLQGFYLAQEAVDRASESIGKDTATGQWDAQGLRLVNLGDPQGPQDAMTYASARASVEAAAASAEAAANSEANAAQSASDAQGFALLASDWAQKLGSFPASAKEWAVGTLLRGLAGGGSAKDWATYTGGTVDDTEYSAKKYAMDAANSAATAQAAVGGVKITNSDTTADKLNTKLTVTANLSKTVNDTGGNETLQLDVLDSPKWDGATRYVSTNAPDPEDGEDGDIWFEREE